jgi:hypothetical protein
MELIEVMYTLILINIFQAYQVWQLQNKNEEILDLIVGLHLGDITIVEKEDDDEY